MKTRFSYAFPKEFPYRMNHVSQFSSHYCIAIWRCIFTLFPASKKFRKFKFSLCSFQILECEFYLLELMVSGDIGALSLSSVFVLVCSIWLVALTHFPLCSQDCCLIVYHPYRPLLQYVQDMGQEDMLLPLAWYGSLVTLIQLVIWREGWLSSEDVSCQAYVFYLYQANSQRHIQDRPVSALPSFYDRLR